VPSAKRSKGFIPCPPGVKCRFSANASAALVWTHAVTQVSESPGRDDTYEGARKHFTEKELVDLTLAIVATNSWNRLATSFRSVPGSYEPSGQ
jgi:alkylhydroperoxidase family enzyme